MKKNFFIKYKGFSLLEIMMALVIVSIMLAVLAPVFTVKNSSSTTSINVTGGAPVGVIAAWYGTNYPNGWLPVDGRAIDGPEYATLRAALGGRDVLPDLNRNRESNDSMSWIIKAQR